MLGTPMLCKYFVNNISEDVQFVQVQIAADNKSFLIAGELLTNIDLMPFSDPY